MNIFIETPQRAAERMENRRRQQERLRRDGAASGGVATGNAVPASFSTAAVAAPDLDLDEVPGYERADRQGSASQASAAPEGCSRQDGLRSRQKSEGREPQSVAADAYRDEKAYDRKRARRHKRAHALRVVAFVLFMPMAIAAVFLISYVLTCVLNGATPEEVVASLSNLVQRVEGLLIQANLL